MNRLISEYEGGTFHPELPKGKAGGTVCIDGGFITFKSETFSFQLPLEGVEIKMGGARDRLVFFSHPMYPDQTLYSRESAILDDPHIKTLHSTRTQLTNVKLGRLKRRFWFGLLLATVLAFFFGLYLLKNPIAKMIAGKLPPSTEDTIGQSAIDQYRTSADFVESEEVDASLQRLLQPLVDSIYSDRYVFKFYVINDSSLNAFALPGGHIVLHTGLILSAESAEEILGVVAHEIAHVTQQHGMRRFLESAGLYVIVSALLGDVSGIGALLVANGAFLLQQQFSREFEREADKLAVAYLAEAAIDPNGLYNFFAKLKAKEEAGAGALSGALALLSTHPATGERMEDLKAAIDACGENFYEPVEFNLETFQFLFYESNSEN